jgi:hypothetical protein
MTGPSSPEVTRAICRVPSTSFTHSPWYALPIHLCRFRVRSVRWGYFPEVLRCTLNPIRGYNLRPSSPPAGPGMLTWFPSTTAFALALGAGSPCADQLYAGTLGFSAAVILTLLSLLMSAFSLPIPPAHLAVHLRRLTERSATARLASHPQLRYVA